MAVLEALHVHPPRAALGHFTPTDKGRERGVHITTKAEIHLVSLSMGRIDPTILISRMRLYVVGATKDRWSRLQELIYSPKRCSLYPKVLVFQVTTKRDQYHCSYRREEVGVYTLMWGQARRRYWDRVCSEQLAQVLHTCYTYVARSTVKRTSDVLFPNNRRGYNGRHIRVLAKEVCTEIEFHLWDASYLYS